MGQTFSIQPVTTSLRSDEIAVIDEFAERQERPYTGSRAAALRFLIRRGMEAEGIAIDLLAGDRSQP